MRRAAATPWRKPRGGGSTVPYARRGRGMACHALGRGHGFNLDAVVAGGLSRVERQRTFRKRSVTSTVRMCAWSRCATPLHCHGTGARSPLCHDTAEGHTSGQPSPLPQTQCGCCSVVANRRAGLTAQASRPGTTPGTRRVCRVYTGYGALAPSMTRSAHSALTCWRLNEAIPCKCALVPSISNPGMTFAMSWEPNRLTSS